MKNKWTNKCCEPRSADTPFLYRCVPINFPSCFWPMLLSYFLQVFELFIWPCSLITIHSWYFCNHQRRTFGIYQISLLPEHAQVGKNPRRPVVVAKYMICGQQSMILIEINLIHLPRATSYIKHDCKLWPVVTKKDLMVKRRIPIYYKTRKDNRIPARSKSVSLWKKK